MNQIQTGEVTLVKVAEIPMDQVNAPSGVMGETRVMTNLEVAQLIEERMYGGDIILDSSGRHLSEEGKQHNSALSRQARREGGSYVVSLVARRPFQ